MKIYPFFFIAVLCACSGYNGSKDKDEIALVADSFAMSYFNLDFPSSVNHCTPESRRWLSFYASNISEKDIEVLAGLPEPVSCDITDIEVLDDTSAVATCSVSGFPEMGAIGCPVAISEQGIFEIPVVKRQGRWLVKMEAPLQSGKQSRD